MIDRAAAARNDNGEGQACDTRPALWIRSFTESTSLTKNYANTWPRGVA